MSVDRALLERAERAVLRLDGLSALLPPISTVTQLQRSVGLTFPTVAVALGRMKQLGIVTELTGKRRNRLFAYAPYIAILSEGAAPLKRHSKAQLS